MDNLRPNLKPNLGPNFVHDFTGGVARGANSYKLDSSGLARIFYVVHTAIHQSTITRLEHYKQSNSAEHDFLLIPINCPPAHDAAGSLVIECGVPTEGSAIGGGALSRFLPSLLSWSSAPSPVRHTSPTKNVTARNWGMVHNDPRCRVRCSRSKLLYTSDFPRAVPLAHLIVAWETISRAEPPYALDSHSFAAVLAVLVNNSTRPDNTGDADYFLMHGCDGLLATSKEKVLACAEGLRDDYYERIREIEAAALRGQIVVLQGQLGVFQEQCGVFQGQVGMLQGRLEALQGQSGAQGQQEKQGA